jgi:hypothetical protein
MRSVVPAIATFLTLALSMSRAEANPKPIDPCGADALKLGAATPVAVWKPPAGCRAKRNSIVLSTKAALDAQFDCAKGTAVVIDFTKYRLVQVTQNMLPAALELDALDDGKTLTLVTRFRNRCPKDAFMPSMSRTIWFLLRAGTDRSLDRASCLVEMKCP